MAKLTKAQKQTIQTALNAINRLTALIERDDIAFCLLKDVNADTSCSYNEFRAREIHETKHYVGKDGYEWDIKYIKSMTPMDKGVGSDLVARVDVKKSLERLLAE